MDNVTYKVPMYLKATSEEDLVRSMLSHNIKSKMMVKYHDIQKTGKFWYAWYLGDASELVKKAIEVKANAVPKDN